MASGVDLLESKPRKKKGKLSKREKEQEGGIINPRSVLELKRRKT